MIRLTLALLLIIAMLSCTKQSEFEEILEESTNEAKLAKVEEITVSTKENTGEDKSCYN